MDYDKSITQTNIRRYAAWSTLGIANIVAGWYGASEFGDQSILGVVSALAVGGLFGGVVGTSIDRTDILDTSHVNGAEIGMPFAAGCYMIGAVGRFLYSPK